MESKQHAPKKIVMCVSGAIQTQFCFIYTTCIINFYIEKHVLALDVAASCLFNLWKVKSASGVAWRLLPRVSWAVVVCASNFYQLKLGPAGWALIC